MGRYRVLLLGNDRRGRLGFAEREPYEGRKSSQSLPTLGYIPREPLNKVAVQTDSKPSDKLPLSLSTIGKTCSHLLGLWQTRGEAYAEDI
jgi:hypothetical protein